MRKTSDFELLPEVSRFLADAPILAVFGGQSVAADDGETFTTLDPGTGQPLARVAALKAAEVDRAVAAAAKAFPAWSETCR